MRALALISLLATIAIASGCGGSSSAAPSTTATTQATTAPQPVAQPAPKPTRPARIYTKKELAKLVLQPKDAPADMRYLKGESGPRTLEQIGFILPRQIKEMRAYGYRAARDAVFQVTSPQSDRRVAERVWLMKSPAAASRWLARSKDDSLGLGFQQIVPEQLGDESWAAAGGAAGGSVLTHAFRLGNAVFVVTSFASSEDLSPAAARAAAAAAFARARKV